MRVLVSFTVCEEGFDLPKPNGSEKIARMGGDWAVACEPTCRGGSPVLGIGTQGHARAFVRFRGKAAHSSVPEEGRNAIHAAARFCVKLGKLNASYRAVEIVPGSKARPTVAPTIVAGGTLSNIIPDAAQVTVSRRFAPGETVAKFRRELGRLLAAEDASFEVLSDGAGALTGKRGVLVAAAERAAGARPRMAFFRGRTDAIIYARRGMDTLTMGPGTMGQCHVANEYVELDGAAAAVRALERLANTIG
jgi:succinyl-diaminopimelate desuccinylase